jgi:hypothetical protein
MSDYKKWAALEKEQEDEERVEQAQKQREQAERKAKMQAANPDPGMPKKGMNLEEAYIDAFEAKKDELKLTPDESVKFKKAFKDPKFRDMMTEYIDEISDPKHRGEQEQYIRELEKDGKAPKGKEFIKPEKGFVVKCKKQLIDMREDLDNVETPMGEEDKIFINMVHSPMVAEGEPVVQKGGTSWSLPYTLGPLRVEKDKEGGTVPAIDCCYGSKTFNKSLNQPGFQKMLVTTAIEAVENQWFAVHKQKVRINRDFRVLKGIDYKTGEPPMLMVEKQTTGGAPTGADALARAANKAANKPATGKEKRAAKKAGKPIKSGGAKGPLIDKATGAPLHETGGVRKTWAEHEAALKELLDEGKDEAGAGGEEDDDDLDDGIDAAEAAALQRADKGSSGQATATGRPLDGTPAGRGAPDPVAKPWTDPSLSVDDRVKAATDELARREEVEESLGLEDSMKAASRLRKEARSKKEQLKRQREEALASGKPRTPEYVLKERGQVDMANYMMGTPDQGQTNPTNIRPKELVCTLQLPLMKSGAGMQLDVSASRLLFSDALKPKLYFFELPLPYEVFEDKGSAKWDKEKCTLTVTMPVQPPPKPVAPPSRKFVVEEVEDFSSDEEEEDEKPEVEEEEAAAAEPVLELGADGEFDISAQPAAPKPKPPSKKHARKAQQSSQGGADEEESELLSEKEAKACFAKMPKEGSEADVARRELLEGRRQAESVDELTAEGEYDLQSDHPWVARTKAPVVHKRVSKDEREKLSQKNQKYEDWWQPVGDEENDAVAQAVAKAKEAFKKDEAARAKESPEGRRLRMAEQRRAHKEEQQAAKDAFDAKREPVSFVAEQTDAAIKLTVTLEGVSKQSVQADFTEGGARLLFHTVAMEPSGQNPQASSANTPIEVQHYRLDFLAARALEGARCSYDVGQEKVVLVLAKAPSERGAWAELERPKDAPAPTASLALEAAVAQALDVGAVGPNAARQELAASKSAEKAAVLDEQEPPVTFRQNEGSAMLLIKVSGIEPVSVSSSFEPELVDISFRTLSEDRSTFSNWRLRFVPAGRVDVAACRVDVATNNMMVVLGKADAGAEWTSMKADAALTAAAQVRKAKAAAEFKALEQAEAAWDEAASFNECPQFSGARKGFHFKMGHEGLGYYRESSGKAAPGGSDPEVVPEPEEAHVVPFNKQKDSKASIDSATLKLRNTMMFELD